MQQLVVFTSNLMVASVKLSQLDQLSGNGPMPVAVGYKDVVLRIENLLVVILSVDVDKILAEITKLGKRNYLAIELSNTS